MNESASGILDWLTEHRNKIGWMAGTLMLLLVLPLSVYLVSQQQRESAGAWVCNNVEVTNNNDGTYTVVVTQGNAEWWRIVSLSNNQVISGPQEETIFDHISLPDGEYQTQASDNQIDWTTQNCIFTVQSGEGILECKEVIIYDENGQQIGVNDVFVGQTIQIAVNGETDDPDGITKARFSFDGGSSWTETTNINDDGEFYVEIEIVDTSPIEIEAQVFNSNLGWK